MTQLRIGLSIMDAGDAADGLEGLLARFRQAEAQGFATAWIPNIFSMDALTLAALVGRETRRLEIGTAVVPTFSRHPLYMAQQALSTQAACGGRFVCGLGPSHRVVIEDMLGLSYERPARHMREYLEILQQLNQNGRCDFRGETYRVAASLKVTGSSHLPILVGALGPRMRRVAGRLADGTITWMTGPRALGELVPDLRAAAESAGRPEPRVVAGLPVLLTHEADAAREAASRVFAVYGTLPSYRAMLDLEGGAEPADVALIGDEKFLEQGIQRLADAGATDLNAAIFPFGAQPETTRARTEAFLAGLAGR